MPKTITVEAKVILPNTWKGYECETCKSDFIIASIKEVVWCPICQSPHIKLIEEDKKINIDKAYECKRCNKIGVPSIYTLKTGMGDKLDLCTVCANKLREDNRYGETNGIIERIR